jgi:serine/threonine protein phosphatase 1
MTVTFNFTQKINEDDVIALGDIHARYDLFELFLDHVKDTGATVILLGDMIDRGGQDLEVLVKVKQLLDDPGSHGLAAFHALQGNHEWMMVNAADGYRSDVQLWAMNGGNYEHARGILAEAPWVKKLPLFMTVGETLFTHAGIWPGSNPVKDTVSFYQREQLLWMRQPFLTEGPEFVKWNPNLKRIVFGHTPRGPLPYALPTGDGYCIDTAAYYTGVLTSYNATRDTFWQYTLNDD